METILTWWCDSLRPTQSQTIYIHIISQIRVIRLIFSPQISYRYDLQRKYVECLQNVDSMTNELWLSHMIIFPYIWLLAKVE